MYAELIGGDENMKGILLIVLSALVLSSCSTEKARPTGIGLDGKWIRSASGDVMLDPQTSGLIYWRNSLVTVADGSGHESQRLKLHRFNPSSAKLSPHPMQMLLSEKVKSSCFADYLSAKPDYEGLVSDPNNDNIFILVTEDASRTGELSPDCADKFSATGSTEYPTLLVRMEWKDEVQLMVTHVRPIQFAAELDVGNFPNDGIEGMAFGDDRTLYLGLEKDNAGKPRIFSIKIDEDFWQSADFVQVRDPQFPLPEFTSGSHPINGMDYIAHKGKSGYLVAAARNDSELWLVDVAKENETIVVPLHFYAEITDKSAGCGERELMDNASIEGVAVSGDQIWLINDPWKVNYHKNIQCDANRSNYEKMAPLVFSLPIDDKWFPNY